MCAGNRECGMRDFKRALCEPTITRNGSLVAAALVYWEAFLENGIFIFESFLTRACL